MPPISGSPAVSVGVLVIVLVLPWVAGRPLACGRAAEGAGSQLGLRLTYDPAGPTGKSESELNRWPMSSMVAA